MAEIFYILALAIINRLRGWGPTDEIEQENEARAGLLLPPLPVPLYLRTLKYLTSKIIATPFYIGLATLAYTGDVLTATFVGLGYQWWAIPGHGDYWDGSTQQNNEVHWIDWLVSKFVKPGRLNDTISMSLRGLYGYPAFVSIASIQHNKLPLFVGFGMLLQGVIDNACNAYLPNKHWRLVAELLTGALWGILLTIVIGGA